MTTRNSQSFYPQMMSGESECDHPWVTDNGSLYDPLHNLYFIFKNVCQKSLLAAYKFLPGPDGNMLKYLIFRNYRFCLVYGDKRHFQQYFSYILAVRFIGRGNRSTQRKQPTCPK